MLNKEEIKAAFYAGKYVDRYGTIIGDVADINDYTNVNMVGHYMLMDGSSPAQVLKALKDMGLSDFEAKFALGEFEAFVRDILEVNLDEHNAMLFSDEAVAGRMSHELTEKLNANFSYAVNEPIEYKEKRWDANSKSIAAMNNAIAFGEKPEYWVDANNDVHNDITIADLKAIVELHRARETKTHALMTEKKSEIRVAMEKQDLHALSNIDVML